MNMKTSEYKSPEICVSGLDAEFDFADLVGGAGASGEAGIIDDGSDYVF